MMMFTCLEVVSLVICNDFSRQRRLFAGRGRGTTRQCLVGLNSRTRRGKRLGSREGKPLSMSPVSSVLLCYSVRNRTFLRIAGEVFLSQSAQSSRSFLAHVSSPQKAFGIQRSQSVSAKEGCWMFGVRCWWLAKDGCKVLWNRLT